MLTHDRGTSVGMIALSMFDAHDDRRPADRPHLDQRQHLSPAVKPHRLSEPRCSTPTGPAPPRPRPRRRCWPPAWVRRPSCRGGRWAIPRSPRWHKCFAYNDGIRGAARHHSISQRARSRRNDLARKHFPTARSTPRWCGACTTTWRPCGFPTMSGRRILKNKPGRNRYWVVPAADHYVQCDAPAQLAQIVRLTAGGGIVVAAHAQRSAGRCGARGPDPMKLPASQDYSTASQTRSIVSRRDASS